MNDERQVSLALKIAYEAHSGQVDKAGQPYILHPLRVALSVPTSHLKSIALLHDVVEDTTVSLDALKKAKVADATVHAVSLLTKIDGETLTHYWNRVATNRNAVIVKVADMLDNIARLDGIESAKDRDRLAVKYQHGLDFLDHGSSIRRALRGSL